MTKAFNETVATYLKQCSQDLSAWFSHLLDHARRYNSSSKIYIKRL